MVYIEAPHRFDRYTHTPMLFMAGGITSCPDWQKDATRVLDSTEVILLNPRRSTPFEAHMSEEQIRWEFDHLRLTNAILFWFPKETVCPITLFEYGKWLIRDKPIFVGTHPEYPRRFDVVLQTQLERPTITVHNSINMVLHEATEWIRLHTPNQ